MTRDFIRILWTRAWLLHIVVNFLRILEWSAGESVWLNGKCIQDTEEFGTEGCPDYNEILDDWAPTLRIVVTVMTFASVLIDIASYKYRHFARSILYFEISYSC